MSKLSKRLRIIFLIAIIVIVLIKLEPEPVWNYFSSKLFMAVLVIQPLLLINIMLTSYRTNILICKPLNQFITIFRATIIGHGLNLFLPARTSELVKVAYLKHHANTPAKVSIAALILEKCSDLWIISILSIVFSANIYLPHAKFINTTIIISLSLLLIFLPKVTNTFERIAKYLPLPKVSQFLAASSHFATDRIKDGSFALSLIAGFMAWLVAGFGIYVLLNLSVDVHLTYTKCMLIFIVMTLGGAIPILPAGLGTFEAAGVFILTQLGFPFDEALALSIGVHISQIGITLLMTLIELSQRKTGLSQLVKQRWGSQKKSTQPPEEPQNIYSDKQLEADSSSSP